MLKLVKLGLLGLFLVAYYFETAVAYGRLCVMQTTISNYLAALLSSSS